jgi:hypothetical protein
VRFPLSSISFKYNIIGKIMNEYTQEQQDMIAAASDLYEDGSSDRAIAMGLTQGDRLVAEMF